MGAVGADGDDFRLGASQASVIQELTSWQDCANGANVLLLLLDRPLETVPF
jgi:hypothetical protein